MVCLQMLTLVFFFFSFSFQLPRVRSREFESGLQVFPQEALSWMRPKSKRRPPHTFLKPEHGEELLDLAAYDATSPYHDECDYSAVDFASRLGCHILRHHATLNSAVYGLKSFLANDYWCSTRPGVVRESIAASNRLPNPASMFSAKAGTAGLSSVTGMGNM